jgi:hypothetical protein
MAILKHTLAKERREMEIKKAHHYVIFIVMLLAIIVMLLTTVIGRVIFDRLIGPLIIDQVSDWISSKFNLNKDITRTYIEDIIYISIIGVLLLSYMLSSVLKLYDLLDISKIRDLPDKLDSYLKTYIPPQRLSEPWISKTKLAQAIRQLAEFQWKKHIAGGILIFEDVEYEIHVSVLDMRGEQQYSIPKAPNGYSWKWFIFKIKMKYNIKPSFGEVIVKLREIFPIYVIAMNTKAYINLSTYRNLNMECYYPVPSIVDEKLNNELLKINFIPNIKYEIAKFIQDPRGDRQVTDWKNLQTKLLIGNNTQNRKEIIKQVFSRSQFDISDKIEDRPQLLDEAAKLIYQIYQVQIIDDDQISINPKEQGCYWRFNVDFSLLIPVKILKDDTPILDQQVFELWIDRIQTIKKISFSKEPGQPIEFTLDWRPGIISYPYLMNPNNINRELRSNNNEWIIEISQWSENYWYPGDVVFLYWKDQLISEMRKGHD